jgi:tripartite-type tricarboxylate transporter receptor subunit TctC
VHLRRPAPWAACTLGGVPSALAQQDWPAKPIRIIVSFAPGGLTDLIARALQPRLQEAQPVIVDNKPGAGGTVAEALLARAPADVYTLLLSADSVPANPHLIPNLGYDSLKDLQPVSLLARIPLVMLVNNGRAGDDGERVRELRQSQQRQAQLRQPGHRHQQPPLL